MKIAVTGASGHIGSHVTRILLEKNYKVVLLVRRQNEHIYQFARQGAEIVLCDLFRPKTYLESLKECDAVFHLAAENTTRKSHAEKVVKNAYELTRTVLTACHEAGIKKIVYTSSVVVLGRSRSPRRLIKIDDRTDYFESPYVKGKVLADRFVEQFRKEKNLDIRKAYPAWVIGPGDLKHTPPHQVIDNYLNGKQFFYFPGGISLCDVRQVAKAHVSILENGNYQEDFILGGDNITFKTFYKYLALYGGKTPPFLKIPRWLIVIGSYITAPLFRLMGLNPPVEPSYAKTVFGRYSWYDSSRSVYQLGYKIIPAGELLKDAVKESRRRKVNAHRLGLKRSDVQEDTRVAKDKLLITGVPGWLGNRMIDILINGNRKGEWASSREVNLLVLPQFKDLINLPDNFHIIYGDLTDKDSIYSALEGVKTVFHLAGAIYPKKIKTLYEVNYTGTRNLVDACIEKGVERIIFMSTDSVCGKGTKEKRIFDEHTPPSPYKHYGKSKFLAEKYILDKTREGLIKGTSLRGFWFFGPFAPARQLNFFKMFRLPRQIVFGNGKNLRSVSHVDNLVKAFLLAEKNENTTGKFYWICGEEKNLTVDYIYQTICRFMGIDFKPVYIPVWLCKLAGLADSILNSMGYLNQTLHAAGKFYFDIAGDIKAAQRDFNYSPDINFEEIARETAEMINE